MKIIKNNIIPFGTYVAITIGPLIFTKRESLSDVTINHEAVHWEQEKETGIIGFYILYVVFFIRNSYAAPSTVLVVPVPTVITAPHGSAPTAAYPLSVKHTLTRSMRNTSQRASTLRG